MQGLHMLPSDVFVLSDFAVASLEVLFPWKDDVDSSLFAVQLLRTIDSVV